MNWNKLNPKKFFEGCMYETAASRYVESLKPAIRKRQKNGATHNDIAAYVNEEVCEEAYYDAWINFDYLIKELEKQFPYLRGKIHEPVEFD